MSKIEQTPEDLQKHLDEQLHFLESSAKGFDAGDTTEAKRMAVHLRTLFHDTEKSQSLLKLLEKKDGLTIFDSSSNGKNIVGPVSGLVMKSIGKNGPTYVAPLDDFPPGHAFKKIPFIDYWTKPIFIDNNKNEFSRSVLILAIANKDGGAHVDPKLDEAYVQLTKKNSLGWIFGAPGTSGEPFENAALAAVRQITHEVLKTLIPDYPEKRLLNTQDGMVFGDLHLSNDASAGYVVSTKPDAAMPKRKIGRNEECPCGAKQKYKRCHGA